MKKKIPAVCLAVLKVIFIIFLAVTLNRIFMPKYINENKDGMVTREYYKNAKYSDVLFVGPSTVFSAIDPLVLWDECGISSYDRANASQTMWISYYMIEDAIRCHKPELVCIDTTFLKYGDDFVEEPSTRKSLDGMRLSTSKIKCALASMGENEKLADYIVPLFRFHTRWKDFSWDDIRYAYYFGSVTRCGFIDDDEVDAGDNGDLVYDAADDRTVSAKNEQYLRMAIELCQSKGIKVLLFKTPAHSGNWSASLDDCFDDIAKQYGITYINFDTKNTDIGLDYTVDTPDAGSHLNTAGAKKFSKYLGDYITSSFDLTSHKSDSRYIKNWEKIRSEF